MKGQCSAACSTEGGSIIHAAEQRNKRRNKAIKATLKLQLQLKLITSMASRNWLGTLNNPEHDCKEWLEKLHKAGKAIYTCGQLEKGAEGTPHIQFFVNFDKSQRLSFCKKLCAKSHWEVVKINNGAHNYCMKEETRLEGPFEYGKKPVQRNNKEDWEEVKKSAIDGQWEKIPAEIYIKHF